MTILLFENGQLYASGDLPVIVDGKNEAVHGPRDHFEPITVRSVHKAKLCSASWEAIFVVTEVDEVFVCGNGGKGELGLGQGSIVAGEFVQMSQFPPEGLQIVDICSSVYHTVAVLSNGEVYGWGNGRKGQLGLPCAIVWEPRRIEHVGFSVHGVACGKDFSVLVGDPLGGEVMVVGSDRWSARSDAPQELLRWVQIGATWGGFVALSDQGKLTMWGRNDRGQLGLSETTRIIRSATGSEHTLRLTDSGILTCHGWGEHGNCGPDVDENGNAPAHPRPIDLPKSLLGEKIEGLGAGCATSFLWTSEQTAYEGRTQSAMIESE